MTGVPRGGKLVAIGGGLFIALVICALVASLVGPIVDDLTSAGSGSGDSQVLTPGTDDRVYQNVLQTAVAASPEDPVAQISLARLLSLGGNATEAFAHYQKAIDLDPENAAYRIDFGRALASAQHFPDAEIQYQRAIALAPDDPEPHYWLGELYRAWQPPKTAEAASEFERAISIAPQSVSGRLAQESLQRLRGTPTAADASPAVP